MTDDVVAELDRRLGTYDADQLWVTFPPALARRARDEIVALREMRDAHVRILSARLDEDEENMRRWIAKAREEALEEAAGICDLSAEIMQPDADDGRVSDAIAAVKSCAAAIRAMRRAA